jgi:hypothetical protein
VPTASRSRKGSRPEHRAIPECTFFGMSRRPGYLLLCNSQHSFGSRPDSCNGRVLSSPTWVKTASEAHLRIVDKTESVSGEHPNGLRSLPELRQRVETSSNWVMSRGHRWPGRALRREERTALMGHQTDFAGVMHCFGAWRLRGKRPVPNGLPSREALPDMAAPFKLAPAARVSRPITTRTGRSRRLHDLACQLPSD